MKDFNQVYVSDNLNTFKEGFINKWKLEEYSNPNEPSIFFGLYSQQDVNYFLNHKSYKILVWGGNDMHDPQFNIVRNEIKQNRTFTFGPPGEFSNVLKNKNILHKSCYIPNKDYTTLPITPLGENIYIYKGLHGNRPDYYRFKEIVMPLMEVFGKDRIIYTEYKSFEDLVKNYYNDCFVFIKPNEKGGCTTMYELAYMGRRTLGQGHKNLPFFTEYKDLHHLIDLIMDESKYIGKIRPKIKKSIESIFVGDEWLNLKFWND
jgi:hypothetical protein